MYLEACGQPQLDPLSPEPPYFSSSSRGERYFCSGCGCPLWFRLTDTDRYFIPWTLLELNEVDRRRLILAAEIYTETQPAFWRLTGNTHASAVKRLRKWTPLPASALSAYLTVRYVIGVGLLPC